MLRLKFSDLDKCWGVDWTHLEGINQAIVSAETQVALILGGYGEFLDLDRSTGVGYLRNLAIAEAAEMPIVIWVVLRPPISREFEDGKFRMETMQEAGEYQADAWLEYIEGHALVKAIGPDWENSAVGATVVQAFCSRLERCFDRQHIWVYTRVSFIDEFFRYAWPMLVRYRLWLAQYAIYERIDCAWEEMREIVGAKWFAPTLPSWKVGGVLVTADESCWVAHQVSGDKFGLPGVMSPTEPWLRARSDLSVIRREMIADFFPDEEDAKKHTIALPLVFR
jgi:hypothetical protein